MEFHGKTAIVTGGAKGLGKSFATALSQEGCAVMIADIDEEELIRTASEITAAGGRCMTRKVDVTGKVAVAVLSGGNVDPDLFFRLVA